MKFHNIEKITKAIENEIEVFSDIIDASKFRELQKQLEKYIIRDALTLSLNRWKTEEVVNREILRSKSDNNSLYLLMFDIDNFKKINDALGHNEGDYILQRVIWDIEFHIENTIGKTHRLGRWGGDEFVYVFPAKNKTEIKKIANDIRSMVENLYYDNKISSKITLSIGVAPLKKSDKIKNLIDRADKAMYKAKNRGGNRVEVSA